MIETIIWAGTATVVALLVCFKGITIRHYKAMSVIPEQTPAPPPAPTLTPSEPTPTESTPYTKEEYEAKLNEHLGMDSALRKIQEVFGNGDQ